MGLLGGARAMRRGLSLYQALISIYRRHDSVLVAFSSVGIKNLAKRGVVIADHDFYTCQQCKCRWDAPWKATECPACGNPIIVPPAGEEAARLSGLPWWMPPNPGDDLNDIYQRDGIDEVARHIRGIVPMLRR